MFEDTLLITKYDYIHKRKPLLLYLLQHGFQLQGHRQIQLTPELAAEFYQDIADEPCFMFQVILLSKGPSEAFILTKENAVEDLFNSLVCYFGDSVQMEQNVHVARCYGKVHKEISFIFPNYIYEPIYCLDPREFCSNNTFVSSVISAVYAIATIPERNSRTNWREKLVDYLVLLNNELPHVSNQCSHNPAPNFREIARQTKVTAIKQSLGGNTLVEKRAESSCLYSDNDGTSLKFTSSSCATCSAFSSRNKSIHQQQVLANIIKSRTVPLAGSKTSSGTNGIDIPMEENNHEEVKEKEADVEKAFEIDIVGETINHTISYCSRDITDIHTDQAVDRGGLKGVQSKEKSTDTIHVEVEDEMEQQDMKTLSHSGEESELLKQED